MEPIRVGFVGLSKTGWASYAHFPFLASSPKYQIVAICNTSVESAREAVKLYQLPTETKAYGDPEDLAKDSNVDLVVCSVRVDKHFTAIAPSVRAGKSVFVEWPLGKNLTEAEELLRLSKESKIKLAVVGLQGRFAPSVTELKKIIKAGKIGKVLSSTWVGYGGNLGPTEGEYMKYMLDKNVGGNLVTIHFGHSVDGVQQVLGQFKTVNSLIANQRPLIQLLNKDGSVAVKDFQKTADDHIFLHGIVEDRTVVSFSLRGGKPFKGTPGLEWRIYGEKGEIRLTAAGPFLQVGYPELAISIHDFASNEVEGADLGKDEFESIPLPARNVARVYEAIAAGDMSLLCDFEDAVERHRFIDVLYKQNGAKL